MVFTTIKVNPPIVDVLEAVAVGDVVRESDPVRASVVRASDDVELLLPGRVPDLTLDALAVDLQGLDLSRGVFASRPRRAG